MKIPPPKLELYLFFSFRKRRVSKEPSFFFFCIYFHEEKCKSWLIHVSRIFVHAKLCLPSCYRISNHKYYKEKITKINSQHQLKKKSSKLMINDYFNEKRKIKFYPFFISLKYQQIISRFIFIFCKFIKYLEKVFIYSLLLYVYNIATEYHTWEIHECFYSFIFPQSPIYTFFIFHFFPTHHSHSEKVGKFIFIIYVLFFSFFCLLKNSMHP